MYWNMNNLCRGKSKWITSISMTSFLFNKIDKNGDFMLLYDLISRDDNFSFWVKGRRWFNVKFPAFHDNGF